jgi:hypothetical protein
MTNENITGKQIEKILWGLQFENNSATTFLNGVDGYRSIFKGSSKVNATTCLANLMNNRFATLEDVEQFLRTFKGYDFFNTWMTLGGNGCASIVNRFFDEKVSA